MKRLFKGLSAILLTLIMVSALAGCADKKEEKAVLRCKRDMNGYAVEMTFDAKGDKATKVTQVSTLDLAEYPEEAVTVVEDALKQMEETYKNMKGVEYSHKKEDNKIIETVIIDLNAETIKTMSESGLMPVESEGDKEVQFISIKQTKESLQKSGWTIEE